MRPFRALSLFAIAAAGLSPFVSAEPALQASGEIKTLETEAGPISVKRVAGGLHHPWGMQFLPDNRLLVTERSGNLRIIDLQGRVSDPVEGVPAVFHRGQGGLLDVAIGPDYPRTGYLYLAFSEPGENGASTALGRGRLEGGRLKGFEVIFRQEPKVPGPNHFGGRIVFRIDGTLFLTLGERYKFDPAQDLSNHLGTIVRLNTDGSAQDDNPFVGQPNARDEIWSYGHRNIEAAAIDPKTNLLWIAEMGPWGGDELNQPQAGRNYGWPEVSWGRHYSGLPIADPPSRPEFADAVRHYTPVISPSGMIYYRGYEYPVWQGSFLIGGLSSQQLVRVRIDGIRVAQEERIPMGKRIRELAVGPSGFIYLSTDEPNGEIWRLDPM